MKSRKVTLIIGVIVLFYVASMIYFFYGLKTIEPEAAPVNEDIIEKHFTQCLDDDDQSNCAVYYATIRAVDESDVNECQVLQVKEHIEDCEDEFHIYQVKQAVDQKSDIEEARRDCNLLNDKSRMDMCLNPEKYQTEVQE